MARLFITFNHEDTLLARGLESALTDKRRAHTMTVPVDARPAGRWERQLLQGLHSADAVIALLTPNGLGSQWVMSQTGMAISCDYSQRTLLLPVSLPGVVPSLVSAFHCFRLRGDGAADIERLAAELDEAITAHQATRPPRLFISHRHKDQAIARRLIDLLESAFHVGPRDLRCTSVPGYKLSVGSHSAESLQADLIGAEIVMGLIAPDTTDSEYVLFELGASWGLRKPTFPLRLRGATYKHVPEVLREKSSLTLEDVSQCLQLVEDVARVTTLDRKASGGRQRTEAIRRQAELLARAARG